ncbi:carbonic anhydrase [Streptomyces sp. NPDC085927]|uniref:carbonic anhydrase n=1 Tax=Streptomyces sp. NPDC085927 TaxID=3365738 RepID=UPI0037D35585
MPITDSEPGELFVISTAGNLVPAHTSGADGVAASIEYAVTVLRVTDIVVCGHSACSAMTVLAESHDLPGTPAIADWLRHADPPRPVPPRSPGRRREGGRPGTGERHHPARQPGHTSLGWSMRWRTTRLPCTAGSTMSPPAPSKKLAPLAPLWRPDRTTCDPRASVPDHPPPRKLAASPSCGPAPRIRKTSHGACSVRPHRPSAAGHRRG